MYCGAANIVTAQKRNRPATYFAVSHDKVRSVEAATVTENILAYFPASHCLHPYDAHYPYMQFTCVVYGSF